MATVGNLFVNIGADTTALGRGLDRAKSMLSGMGSAVSSGGKGLLAGAIMGGGAAAAMMAIHAAGSAVRGIGSAIGESSSRGADLNETLSKTGVLMGGATADAVKFARELQDSGQGQMQGILESITGSAMAMRGMGMETGKAIDMAKQLEARVGDIASQDNIDPAKIREDLQSAFAGEFQIMRKYKVFLDAESLKKTGLPMGEAIAQGIMQQTARAKGDFENTRLSTSNMQRTNSNSVETMMTQFGQAIQPVTQALSYMKSVVLAALSAMNPEGFTGVIDKMRNTIIEMSAGIAITIVGLANGLMSVTRFFLSAVSVIGGFIGDMLIGFGGFSGVFNRMGVELAYRLAQGIDLLIQPFRWIAKQMGISLGEGMTAIVESLGQRREQLDQEAGAKIADARAKSDADKAAMAAALQLTMPTGQGALGEMTGKTMPGAAGAESKGGQRTSFASLLNNVGGEDKKQTAALQQIAANTAPNGGKPGAVNVATKVPGPEPKPQLAGA
jgi:rubrerythrin